MQSTSLECVRACRTEISCFTTEILKARGAAQPLQYTPRARLAKTTGLLSPARAGGNLTIRDASNNVVYQRP